jgi:amidase
MPDLAFQSATELAAAIRDRKVGALELLDLYLARVERHNPALNCVVGLVADAARARARAADAATAKGESWGPLHGVPMTLKESFDFPGLPTTFGLTRLKDNIATRPALAAQRLLDAGAVIFGKTNVPEMLADWQSYNEVYGTANNPWDQGRSPGGSSGGSAATVAAGLTGMDVGSDIAGSIRNPANFCGTFGHKPSWGLLPPRGHTMPMAPGPAAQIAGIEPLMHAAEAPADAPPRPVSMSDVSVIGPLARSAEDLAVAVDIMGGPDELMAQGYRLDLAPPRATSLKDLRVAVWTEHPLAPIDAGVQAAIDDATAVLEKAGAKVDRKARPTFDVVAAHRVYMQLFLAVTSSRQPPEVQAEAEKKVKTLAADDWSVDAVATRAMVIRHGEWLALNEARNRVRWAWHRFFRDHDVLLAPVNTTPAFPHDHEPDQGKRRVQVNGQPRPYEDNMFWTGHASLAYLPSTVAPVGFAGGLTVGVQIIADHLNDRTSIEAARLLSREIGGFVAPKGYD